MIIILYWTYQQQLEGYEWLFAPEPCRVALMGHGINDFESSRNDGTHTCMHMHAS